MNNLEILKLGRALWNAYIDREDLEKAIECYQEYINNLKNHKEDENSANNEIILSRQLFQIKMNMLAEKYIKEKNYQQALIAVSAAFKNNSSDIRCVKNYIICLQELKQGDLEVSLLKHLEAISSNDINNYPAMALNYENKGLYTEALELMKKYMEIKGENSAKTEDYVFLGQFYNKYYENVSHKYSDLQNSVKYFAKAAFLAPEINLYARNTIMLAAKSRDFETAYKCWDSLKKYNQITADDEFEYSKLCLKTQDFAGWHKYYDTRFLRKQNPIRMPEFRKEKWNGITDLSNSVLLVYCDTGYGFGDTFLIWGYMHRIAKIAKHIIFITQDEIYDLLKNNEYGIEVLSRNNINLDNLTYDFYIPAMSLPAVLNLDRSNISAGSGYIKADFALVNEFKEKYFNNDKFKIGISFSGNKINSNKTRDIPLKEFKPLDSLENVQIYNLTKDINKEDSEILKNNKIINTVENVKNFAQTAAIIANCDVILTSDNCILNLAGAMGIKTFGLFNYVNDARWFDLTGNDVVWYTSVKPFVCNDIDDWQSVILPAADELKQIIKSR